MREYKKFYINGEWVDPITPRECEVIDPATEEVCGVVSLGSEADVDKAVAAAKAAFETFSETSREFRLDLLNKIIAIYKRRAGEIAEAIRLEMGAPIGFASTSQVGAGLVHIMEAARVLETYQFEEDRGPHRLVKEPIGVCGLITPWNWPLNQVSCKVAPALAVGCTMVLKPSEVAPLSSYIYAEILHEAGVPAGVFNMVNGDGATVGSRISSHPDIDMVSFTGSTRAGVMVAQAAAPTVKRVSQELGGKSPNIILDDADLETAIKRSVRHMFANTGQSCNAPSRLLVPKSMLADAEAAAIKVAEKVVLGPTDDKATTMGPVVSKVQFDRIQSLINKGIEEGARPIIGGPGLPEGIEKGYYVRPTIFSDVNNEMTIAREEIFGPVLVMIPYETEEEAIKIANDTVYGLAGQIQCGDLERGRRLARKIRAGNVRINGVEAGADIPFGGYKQSGNGREWGDHGFHDYLEVKAIEGYAPEAKNL